MLRLCCTSGADSCALIRTRRNTRICKPISRHATFVFNSLPPYLLSSLRRRSHPSTNLNQRRLALLFINATNRLFSTHVLQPRLPRDRSTRQEFVARRFRLAACRSASMLREYPSWILSDGPTSDCGLGMLKRRRRKRRKNDYEVVATTSLRKVVPSRLLRREAEAEEEGRHRRRRRSRRARSSRHGHFCLPVLLKLMRK